jgi:hypothetical protein
VPALGVASAWLARIEYLTGITYPCSLIRRLLGERTMRFDHQQLDQYVVVLDDPVLI